MTKLSLIIPFYNEEESLPVLLPKAISVLDSFSGYTFELIPVDDGSSDGTGRLLDKFSACDGRIKPLHLKRNMGHQYAISAGLDLSTGDAAITMDGDGQHPAEVLKEMIRFWLDHPDIEVVQAVRKGNQAVFFKNLCSRLYYLVMRFLFPFGVLVSGASDFRVLSAVALRRILDIPGRYRNLRLVLAGLRLQTHFIEYTVAERIAGESRYSFLKMLNLACDGLYAYSIMPLIRMAGLILFFLFIFAVLTLVRFYGIQTKAVSILLIVSQGVVLCVTLALVSVVVWALSRKMSANSAIRHD